MCQRAQPCRGSSAPLPLLVAPLSLSARLATPTLAQLLKAEGWDFDVVFTSVLKRAVRTMWGVIGEMGLEWLPVHRLWRLNERSYGALQGLNKAETAALHGEGFRLEPFQCVPVAPSGSGSSSSCGGGGGGGSMETFLLRAFVTPDGAAELLVLPPLAPSPERAGAASGS